jgi:hypothetical protein
MLRQQLANFAASEVRFRDQKQKFSVPNLMRILELKILLIKIRISLISHIAPVGMDLDLGGNSRFQNFTSRYFKRFH